ncbi:MAG: sensor domain-containing diguanylate cyclase [Methylobacteriaceae bacterium]|nr:sensor domain-containing diguanylate cyclase [Methylobacteriaceae bacterium]
MADLNTTPRPASTDESWRLATLDSYDILDTSPEETFDRISRLAKHIFRVPMSTLTFIDGHRQWFKSKQCVTATEGPRATALCNTTMEQNEPLVIADLANDLRFAANPHVTEGDRIRFYAGVPLRTPDGTVIGTLCAMDTKPQEHIRPDDIEALSDLACIAMDELELRKVARVDTLTSLLTRGAFRRDGGHAFALARRHNHDLSCVIIDLDHFKAVNDTYGHPVGDLVLREVAKTCRDEIRNSDIIGRIGGEEFALILPHTGRDGGMLVAQKLRSSIAHHHIPLAASKLIVTASFGVAGLDRSIDDLDALIECADKALYSAKTKGRNRCELFERPIDARFGGARRRVLKAGRISLSNGRSTIDCTVRSLSDEGAGLDVISALGIPDQFALQIEADGIYKQVRVVTREARHIEVAFESASTAAAA